MTNNFVSSLQDRKDFSMKCLQKQEDAKASTTPKVEQGTNAEKDGKGLAAILELEEEGSDDKWSIGAALVQKNMVAAFADSSWGWKLLQPFFKRKCIVPKITKWPILGKDISEKNP